MKGMVAGSMDRFPVYPRCGRGGFLNPSSTVNQHQWDFNEREPVIKAPPRILIILLPGPLVSLYYSEFVSQIPPFCCVICHFAFFFQPLLLGGVVFGEFIS
ncbi:hypothetical protein CDAR_45181 [Caerostris darwini]|uniref:Uncharacterized protein n=1 Tax=Caerostris darwini TaxID=1538125 RepID=A0AAV4QE56_9ARAC|nr:hypothetical protein CDAR_45181 [Caerostris darwini]